MHITHYLNKLSHWLLPYTCILCHNPSNRLQDLCEPCLSEFPILTQKCTKCAKELSIDLICGECLKNIPPFDATYSLFSYRDNIKHLILNLKFNHDLINAQILGELFAAYLLEIKIKLPDVIIPIPLHPKRIKERGFNQALEIARPMAKILSLPIDMTSCVRTRHTSAQATLYAEKRHANVKNVFNIKKEFTGLHIALLDDVVTTGSTVSEAAKAFRKAGAKRIDVWCVARALL